MKRKLLRIRPRSRTSRRGSAFLSKLSGSRFARILPLLGLSFLFGCSSPGDSTDASARDSTLSVILPDKKDIPPPPQCVPDDSWCSPDANINEGYEGWIKYTPNSEWDRAFQLPDCVTWFEKVMWWVKKEAGIDLVTRTGPHQITLGIAEHVTPSSTPPHTVWLNADPDFPYDPKNVHYFDNSRKIILVRLYSVTYHPTTADMDIGCWLREPPK